jgi:hypothetical protein
MMPGVIKKPVVMAGLPVLQTTKQWSGDRTLENKLLQRFL